MHGVLNKIRSLSYSTPLAACFREQHVLPSQFGKRTVRLTDTLVAEKTRKTETPEFSLGDNLGYYER